MVRVKNMSYSHVNNNRRLNGYTQKVQAGIVPVEPNWENLPRQPFDYRAVAIAAFIVAVLLVGVALAL